MSGARGSRWSLRAAAGRVLAAIGAAPSASRRGSAGGASERSTAPRASKPVGGDGVRFALVGDPRDVEADEGDAAAPALAGWIERARRGRVGGRGAS